MIEEFLKNPATVGVTVLLLAAISAFARNTVMLVAVHKERVAELRSDYDKRIAEVVALYRERLDTANRAAAEWRQIAEDANAFARAAKAEAEDAIRRRKPRRDE